MTAEPSPIIISASRRTDIPAFYLDWFMAGVDVGAFTVENPYNRRSRRVPIAPGKVHSIVFWSKNYGPFIAGEVGERLRDRGFGLFFNFTLNSPQLRLEPEVPPLPQRLAQLAALAKRFGPASIHWRHDPICFFQASDGGSQTNLGAFDTIARHAEAVGIRHCVSSFCDDYRKIRRRLEPVGDIALRFPDWTEQVPLLEALLATLTPLGMRLLTCCEGELLRRLPVDSGVAAGRCIDHARLQQLYGGRLSHRADSGQRRSDGCGCHQAVDIGSYRLHPCYHRCLYCYANPAAGGRERPPRTAVSPAERHRCDTSLAGAAGQHRPSNASNLPPISSSGVA
ncbi:MAG: DUF1848 family protein [Desulfosarcinaceae bacterium]|nr:DUF1848 family protein [Desulfosarcinaceae bacterium]